MSDRLKEQLSELKLYSLGIVTENKPEGTDYILVTPIEKISIQEAGYINDKERTYSSTLTDIDGKKDNQEIKGVNKVRAKWIPFGHSNRITAPDVRANETVVLFKFGDVDEYYWTTIFREPTIRRLENVVYAFSNLKSGLTAFDKSTSYWLQVDTIHKKVHFHTADNDGEVTCYDIDIDTKNGILIITDNKGEVIQIDTQNNTININTEKEINITSTIVNITASEEINLTAPIINFNGDVYFNGNFTINGDLTVNGDTFLNNNLNVKGDASLDSKLNVKGNTALDSNLDVNGNTALDNSLNVNGDTSLNSNLNVNGNAALHNSLDVNGDTSLNSNLNVNGNAALHSNLNVNGDTSLLGHNTIPDYVQAKQ
jgi:cytoskeletal protein CcmA (bactofilin family)